MACDFSFVEGVIGVPFLLRGRSPETGWDCMGLVEYCQPLALGRSQGPSHIDLYADTDKDMDGAALLRKYFRAGLPQWKLTEAVPGALTLFRAVKAPIHVGLYLGDNRFLHVRPGAQTLISHLDDPDYGGCFADFYLPC